MSQLEIYRGRGDRRGDDITDPLLTHDDACQARGTHAIDSSTPAMDIRGNGHFAADIEPGTLVEIVDSVGRRKKGMVDEVEDVFVRSDLTTFTADAKLVIEVEP